MFQLLRGKTKPSLFSNPNFRYRIRISDDFRSKCKRVTRFNLLASLKNSVFMNRFVEAILTGAGFYAVDTSSKALAITDTKRKEKEVLDQRSKEKKRKRKFPIEDSKKEKENSQSKIGRKQKRKENFRSKIGRKQKEIYRKIFGPDNI